MTIHFEISISNIPYLFEQVGYWHNAVVAKHAERDSAVIQTEFCANSRKEEPWVHLKVCLDQIRKDGHGLIRRPKTSSCEMNR